MTPSWLEEKIENFSRLSDEECASIINNNLLEALESDLYVDWEIVAKFMTIPYEIREPLCKLFNVALRKNNQKIGNFTVGEWVRKYQDRYSGKERGPNTFFEYVSSNPEIKGMPKDSQLMLARIFRMYDYLFIVPVRDLEGPVNNILRFAMRSDSTPQEISDQIRSSVVEQTTPQKIITERISFPDALKKYPDLGEQLITSNYIKLKSFPEPARPSVKNWLFDYTFNMGHNTHDSMERGTYLFQSENTKTLNSSDRQKLAYILKAYDENETVEVNVNLKQVIFPTGQEARIKKQEVSRGNEIPNYKYQISNKFQDSNFQNQKPVREIATARFAEASARRVVPSTELPRNDNRGKMDYVGSGLRPEPGSSVKPAPHIKNYDFNTDLLQERKPFKTERFKSGDLNRPQELPRNDNRGKMGSSSPTKPKAAEPAKFNPGDFKSSVTKSNPYILKQEEKLAQLAARAEKNLPPRQNVSPSADMNDHKSEARQTKIFGRKAESLVLPKAKVEFSSPQKLPFEKQNQENNFQDSAPHPLKITPSGWKTDFNSEQDMNKKPLPKNVVNLKE